jgi:uncharacterized protein
VFDTKIAAMADLHITPEVTRAFYPLFRTAGDRADVIALCGDLTAKGQVAEVNALIDCLSFLTVPVMTVLGNHDHESGSQEELMDLLESAGVRVLERRPFVFDGTGFAGTKGFCGGFLKSRIAPFGERILKMFINETFREANEVNRDLRDMDVKEKIVLYHYSPVKGTCAGEDPEIIPFLGSSILEEPAETFKVDLVLHGHAHHGSPEGKTRSGIPVMNVALPLRGRKYVLIDTTALSRERISPGKG